MKSKLFETALQEAVRFGPSARLLLTFVGNEEALHLHPLAFEKIEEGGFRIEVRVSRYDDAEVVDDVIFLDAEVVETAELQVKQKGAIWEDLPFKEAEEEEP